MGLSSCNSKINEQGRELIEHGTAAFPVACYNDKLHKKSVPWHWHDELEVILVTKGTAIITAASNKYEVRKGEGIFINAGVLHAAWSKDSLECEFHSLTFHPRLIGGSIDSIYWHKYLQPLLSDTMLKDIYFDTSKEWHKDAISAIEHAWVNCAKEPFGYEFHVREALSQLILYISTHKPLKTKKPSERALRNSNRIKLMLQYIHTNFSEAINLSMIAEAAMISESECLRCFRSIIGMSPIQYLKQFRIERACELIISTNETIGKIGSLCGFQDTSYFVKIFRQEKNCTPLEYRKNNN